MIFVLKNIFLFFLFIAAANAQKNAFFLFPDHDIETEIDLKIPTIEEGKEYKIKVPKRGKNDKIEFVEVTFVEENGKRKISIPGEGDIVINTDENGDLSFQISPAQIDEFENLTCELDSKNSGQCTIEPFVSIAGNKIITADKMLVKYDEKGGVNLLEGNAKNLEIKTKNSNSNFNTSETSAGDTLIGVKFDRKKSTRSDNSIFGIKIPFVTDQVKKDDIRTLELSIDTSSLTHRVSNSDNSEYKDKFKVKDGGVKSNILFDNTGQTKLKIQAVTDSGIYYNSNPFSQNGVELDTTSVVGASLDLDEDSKNPNTKFSLVIKGSDPEGNLAKTQIKETKDGRTNNIETLGRTALVVEHNENSNEVGFEVLSDDLKFDSSKSSGEKFSAHFKGLESSGSYQKDQKLNINGKADSVKLSQKTFDFEADELLFAINEDNEQKKYELVSNNAYYNNGKTKASLSDNVQISHTQYKNTENAPLYDGKKIIRDSYMLGHKGLVEVENKKLTIDGRTFVRDINLEGGERVFAASGKKAQYTDPKYSVGVDDEFVIVHRELGNGDDSTYISTAKANFDGKKQSGDLRNFVSTREVIGKDDEGKSIYRIHSSADSVNVFDKEKQIDSNAQKLSLTVVDTKKIKYGTVSADQLKAKDSKTNFDIAGITAALYYDKSDPTTEFLQGEATFSKAGLVNKDMAVDVFALDSKGEKQKVKVIFVENGQNKQYKIFNENGNRISLNTLSDDVLIKSIAESIEYIESPEGRVFIGKNLDGQMKEINKSSDKLYDFNLARIEGIESLDKNFRSFKIVEGKIKEQAPNSFIEAEAGNLSYIENNTKGSQYKEIKATNSFAANGIQDKTTFNIKGSELQLIENSENGLQKRFLKTKALSGNLEGSGNKLKLSNANITALEEGENLYANAKLDKTIFTEGKNKAILESAEVLYSKVDNVENMDLKSKTIEVDSTKKFKMKVTADNQDKIFNIKMYKDDSKRLFQVFAEDGTLVSLDAFDKDDNHLNLLFSSLQTLEDEDFDVLMANEIKGEYQVLSDKDPRTLGFDFNNLTVLKSADGQEEFVEINKGEINLKDKNDLLTSQVNNLSYQKNSDQRSLVSNLKQVQYKTPTQSVLGNNIDLQAFEDNKVKYAQVKLDDVVLSNDKYQITVDSVEVMAYEDDKQKTSELKANSLSGVEAKAVYQLSATDKSGNKSKFIALSHETSDGKYMKLFAEDGSEVNLDITDESNSEAKLVFDSLESFENSKISQKIATQLKGQYQDKSSQDSSIYNFDVAKVNHIKQNKNQMIFADDGSVSLENQNEKATLAFDSFASGKFYVDGVETTQINAENGNLQYKDKKKSLEVNGNFNNVIYQNIKDSDDDITTFSAQGLDFVAVDSKKLLDINGEIDNVSLYNSNEIRVIDIDGLKNTRLEDKKNNILADINAGKVLQVVKKDKDGKTLSSYLLLKSSDLKAKDKGNGVTANIKADVLEFIQDKENKQNILLDANISGNINIDKTKSPVNATVDFALKGKRLVTESDSVVSDDGNSVSKYFAIKAIDSKGKLDHLSLNAGPNFLKDAISIEAKGGENGGKKLSFEFMQDKEQGTYFVRAKFIEGDKVKIKLFPFTLESKLQGNDALAELLITPKGQNYLNHLEIITNVVSANEITDWLDISNGGMLIARTGDIAGVGIEMMYQDHNTIDIRDEQSRFRQGDVAATYGAGVYYENGKGDRTSAGLMLSGDSEFAYQTNGRGVLKIFGKKMDKEGRIPATLNLYFKKDYADGDAFYAGVHADLASYTIDENKLNKDAAFFDGGRQSGKLGATIGYSKKLENNARFSITLGANNDFQDAAVCMTYSTPLGDTDNKVTSLTAASMDIVNELADQKEFKRRDISSMGPTLEAAVIKVEDDIEELHRKYKSVKAVELAKEKISKTLAMIKDGESNARKLSREFRFNQKDLKTLANLAKEGVLSKSTVESIKIITEKLKVDAYYDRQTRVLDIHSEQVKLAMKDFAKAFKKESSAKLHKQYLEKLSELSNEF